RAGAGVGVSLYGRGAGGDGLRIAIFGQNPVPGATLYLGFRNPPPQEPIAFGLRFQGPGNDAEERDRIVREAAAQREACREILPDIHCEGQAAPGASAFEPLHPHHSARVVWEASTGIPDDPWVELEPVAMPGPPDPGQVVDDTRSLTLDGLVEVGVPPAKASTPVGGLNLYYVRCRLVAG